MSCNVISVIAEMMKCLEVIGIDETDRRLLTNIYTGNRRRVLGVSDKCSNFIPIQN